MQTAITFIILLVSALTSSLSEKGISWNKTTHDFGDIKRGEKVKTVFTCYNNSDTLLIFENIAVSCGCLATEWPRNPISPGDSANINIEFDSEGKSRKHVKTIAVYTSQGLFELTLKANIVR